MVPRAIRLFLPGALLCALSLGAAATHAAPTAAQVRAEAKSRFDRAIRLFEDGNYESALVEFRTSMVGYPTRVAAFNITVCLRKLGRFDEEEDALGYVAERFPSTRRADVVELERARQEAADRIATLTLSVNEPGATVWIDGRRRGETPLAPLRVSAGVRTVQIKKSTFHTYEVRLDLPARTERTLVVALEAETAPPHTDLAPRAETSPPSLPPRAPRSRAPLWPAFALGGAGLATGVAGAVFLGLRSGTVGDARGTCRPGLTDTSTFATCEDLEGHARTQGLLGGVLLGSGAALLVGAGVYLGVRGASDRPAVSLRCAPALGGLGCTGSF